MHKRFVIAGYRLGFGVLTLAAVAVQFWHGLERPEFSTANFFHFFTIESNILAAMIFVIAGLGVLAGKKASDGFARLRGAATVYMVVTGIVYVLLLSGLEESLQTPIPWINTVLHYVMPVAVLADWLLVPPKRRIAFGRAAVWLIFPLAYGVYSLVRGHITDWYPYPFLNPAEQGYGGVAAAGAAIAVGLVGVVWIVSRIPSWRQSA